MLIELISNPADCDGDTVTKYSADIVMVFGTSLYAHLQTIMNFCLSVCLFEQTGVIQL